MTWFTWRQFRTQTWVAAGALVALGILLVVTARGIADAYADAGLAACQGDCRNAIDSFLSQVRSSAGGRAYDFAMGVMYVVPALIGIFWGAPLVARELETGTHRLAWTQSVTRTRWLATKLGVVAAVTAAASGLLSWAVTTWSHRIDEATGDRITPLVYGARGIVPVGHALFAFALGVTLGMLIRRTVPAMAATLAGYVAVVAAMPLWIRAHLMPATHTTRPLDVDNLRSLMIGGEDGEMQVIGESVQDDAWNVSNRSITPGGEVFTGPADPQYCGPDHPPGSCSDWVGTLGLRQDITYHPAGHFWPLQWIETGIFVAAAAALTAFCFWWLRRRLT